MRHSNTNRSCEDVPNFLLFVPFPGSVRQLYLKHLVMIQDFPGFPKYCPDVGLGTGDHLQNWLLILLEFRKGHCTGAHQHKPPLFRIGSPILVTMMTKFHVSPVVSLYVV